MGPFSFPDARDLLEVLVSVYVEPKTPGVVSGVGFVVHLNFDRRPETDRDQQLPLGGLLASLVSLVLPVLPALLVLLASPVLLALTVALPMLPGLLASLASLVLPVLLALLVLLALPVLLSRRTNWPPTRVPSRHVVLSGRGGLSGTASSPSRTAFRQLPALDVDQRPPRILVGNSPREIPISTPSKAS